MKLPDMVYGDNKLSIRYNGSEQQILVVNFDSALMVDYLSTHIGASLYGI